MVRKTALYSCTIAEAFLSSCSDSFVMEYCGEVCTTEEFMRRKKEYYKERRRHYYFMSLKSDEVSTVCGHMYICT